jgi:hypothetical protein
MGVHGLPVEMGRWRGVHRFQRTCDMCDTGGVGDEHHFVFVCRALAAVRTHYAPWLALESRTLRAFLWQPDLLMVVRYNTTVSSFVLGSSVRVLVSYRFSLIWLD